MCGINGFSWEDKDLIKKMVKTTSYRGPDDTGFFTDNDISLGHNRLSIVDLTKAGQQPMQDKDGRLWLIFNGEIYNHKEIRQELEEKGHNFISNSDSEVIIYAYKEYGRNCVKRFNGMFAFAIWDTIKKELFIARDRIGIKPLYYHHDNGKLIFSSEIKAILQHPVKRDVDLMSFNSFLTYRFIANERTMLHGIKKLMPGHTLIFKDGTVNIERYWKLSWDIQNKTLEHYTKEVDRLLIDAVDKRLMSDVPLGIFLSGGLDSSLITAINTKLRSDPVKTFSVGFGHKTDELSHAQKVADKLGTDHKEIVLDYRTLTRELPKIIWHMDEPHTDITMMPLYFLSRFARKQVTVVNTGEGADELFSGYYHYYIGSNWFRPVPGAVKKKVYDYYYSPFKQKERNMLMNVKTPDDDSLAICLDRKGPILNRILHFDIKHELPNWQLTRVDRMTMAHGMEARVPFLDHRMVELAARIPPSLKQKGLVGKHVLKKVAMNYLPKNIVHRKKQGFTTPMHAWLKHDLLGFSENLLTENTPEFINKTYVEKLIVKQKKSQGPRLFDRTSYQLLIMTMFTMWHKMYVENDVRPMSIEDF